MKRLFFILGTLICFFLGIFLLRNLLLKEALIKGLGALTGLPVTIGSLNLGIKDPSMEVRNIIIFNPPYFEDKIMADIPELYVKYDFDAFLKGRIHLSGIRFHLKELMVVKTKKGEFNLDALKALVRKKKKGEDTKEAKAKKPREVRIDHLALKVERVVYKDYSQKTPVTREFIIGLDERYSRIDSPKTLVNLIVLRALAKTTIANLAGFEIKELERVVDTALKAPFSAGKVAGEVLDKTKNILKDTAQGIGNFLKK